MRKGQQVTWNTSQGKTEGKIVERHTSDLEFEGQTFRASNDDPVCIVESAKTGKCAAHHESALMPKE